LPGSDDSRRTLRRLVETRGTQRPQHHRRSAVRPSRSSGTAGTAECGKREQRPLVTIWRDQSPSATGKQLKILCGPVYYACGLGVPCQVVIDQAAPDPVGRLLRANAVHQCGQFRAGRFRHPGQVSPTRTSRDRRRLRSSLCSRLPKAQRGSNFVEPGRASAGQVSQAPRDGKGDHLAEFRAYVASRPQRPAAR
jgi:hypothetical protein